jgi:hypothetical protein
MKQVDRTNAWERFPNVCSGLGKGHPMFRGVALVLGYVPLMAEMVVRVDPEVVV